MNKSEGSGMGNGMYGMGKGMHGAWELWGSGARSNLRK